MEKKAYLQSVAKIAQLMRNLINFRISNAKSNQGALAKIITSAGADSQWALGHECRRIAGYECIHKSLCALADTDAGAELSRGFPSAFMWPHHHEPQAALTHDRLRLPPLTPPPLTTLAAARPCHCTATTPDSTHMPRHAPHCRPQIHKLKKTKAAATT